MVANVLRAVSRLLLCTMVLGLAACGGGGGGSGGPAAPSGLSYMSPIAATVNVALPAASPVVTGSVVSYSVSPALPAGLSLNTTSGVISGTPTAITAQATYAVTATNAVGSTSFALALAVNPAAPSALSYTSPVTATVATPLTPLSPTVTGQVASYGVLPALPAGLALDTTTGVISGTPTAATAQATYTVTATNAGGSTTFGVVITVGASAAVTGVAASGAPIAGALVTLKDAAGHTGTATTGSDGSFSIDVTGFTPPYVLSVGSGSTALYSFTAQAGVANLTPYTTGTLVSYYAALGTTPATVFGGTIDSTSVPSPTQLALLLQPLVSALQPYLVAAGVPQPTQFNPFTIVFTANHTGFDIVLDRTVVGSGTLTLTVDNGTGSTAGPLSSTLTVTVTPASGATLASVTVTTVTTVSGGGSSSSQQVVPVGTTAQQSALAAAESGVLAIFAHWHQLVTTKGSAIVAADILPDFDPAFLEEGQTATQAATKYATALAAVPAGVTITADIVRLNRYDATAQTLDLAIHIAFASSTAHSDGYLQSGDNPGYGAVFRMQSGGAWAFYGQQTQYAAAATTNAQRAYDAGSGTPNVSTVSLNMQSQVRTAPGALSAAAVAGPASSLPDCTQTPAPLTLSSVVLVKQAGLFSGQEHWDLPCTNGNASSGTPPSGGTSYTFSLTRASDSVVVHQNYPLNGTTRDVGDITQINATARATFAAGHTSPNLAGTTLTIDFVPPTTFPVLYSFITGFCQNATEVASGGGTEVQGAVGNIPSGVTTGSIALPTLCNGAAPAAINVGVWFVGLNGERSEVAQNFHH